MAGDSVLDIFVYIKDHFLDPNKRLFWGYLASTLVLTSWVWWRSVRLNQTQSSFTHYLFNRKIWLHPSAKIDYGVWLINNALKAMLILPLMFSAAPIAINLSFALEAFFGDNPPITYNKTTAMLVFTLLLFVLDDFTRFLLHLLAHKIPFLWQLHKVHHSAEVMTPITVYRIHPLESVLYAIRLVSTQGLALGLGFYLFGHQLSIIDVLGANVGIFIFNLFGANLRHSHVWLTWPKWLEVIFISPAQHQIHHSDAPEHRDKNLGSALAIWDKLYGSLVLSASCQKRLTFGLGKTVHSNLWQTYWLPIKTIIKNKGYILRQPPH